MTVRHDDGPRYIDAIDKVFEHAVLKHLNRRQGNVLIWIARRAHRDSWNAGRFWTCWGFQEQIAWETGLSVRNVKRAQAELVELGLITRWLGRYKSGKRGYYYRLCDEVDLYDFGVNGKPIRGEAMTDKAKERLAKSKSEGDNPDTLSRGQPDHFHRVTGGSLLLNGRGQGDHLDRGQGCPPKREIENEVLQKENDGKFSDPQSENDKDDKIDYAALAERRRQERQQRDADLRAGFGEMRRWSDNRNGHYRN